MLQFFWVFQVCFLNISFNFPCRRCSVTFFLTETVCYLTAISSCAIRYYNMLYFTLPVVCDAVNLFPAALSLASEISKCSFMADWKSERRWGVALSSYSPITSLFYYQHSLKIYTPVYFWRVLVLNRSLRSIRLAILVPDPNRNS